MGGLYLLPDHTLWRMRVDGSDRLQLVFPPTEAILPQWSPDGKRIAYGAWNSSNNSPGIYVVNADGGTPQKIADDANCPFWSSDGSSIGNAGGTGVRIIDLSTRKVTRVPGAEDKFGPNWSPDGRFIDSSSTTSRDKLMLFDVKRQKWSELASGSFEDWVWSRDSHYVYYVVFNPGDPKAQRIRVADRHTDLVASLKDVRRAFDPYAQRWSDIAPDGSLLLMRDIGTQEIYALNVLWP